MALRTSVGTGNWSVAGTWDTGVPVNGDTFLIAAGHTVTLDKDNITDGVTLGASQIAATGTLICSTATGAYSLSLSGDLNLDGTLQAGTDTGTPLPSDVTFTIDFTSTASSIQIDDTNGSLQLYCGEPTNKYVKLTATEPIAETSIAVDTDVSSDWANDDWIVFVDCTSTEDSEEAQISSMTSSVITIKSGGGAGGGLTREKLSDSYIFLRERNIKIINSTTYIVEQGNSGTIYIGAEVYDCTYGVSSSNNGTVAGAMYLDQQRVVNSCTNMVVNGCYASANIASNTMSLIYACDGVTCGSESLFGSSARQIYISNNITCNGNVVGGATAFHTSNGIVMNGDIVGAGWGFLSCGAVVLSGDTKAVGNTFEECYDMLVLGSSIGGSAGGQTSTDDFDSSGSGKCFNVTFGATIEFSGYDDKNFRKKSSYLESNDHDGTANAFKAWCVGGTVVSQTASPPTGYTTWYEFTAEDTTQAFPVFRQYETVVQPGNAIEVDGKIRMADGEDLSSVPPKLQIIDKAADPIIDSTQTALDSDQPATIDGTELGWQDVSVIWANQGDSPKNVIVRMIVEHDGGGDDLVVDGVWAVATYKDQINETLKRVKRISAGSEIS